jgi:hypothetical protein
MDDAAVVTMGEADYAPFYRSLEDLTRVFPVIVVGTVENVLLPFDPRPGYLGVPLEEIVGSPSPKSSWTPSPEEMARPPGRNFAVYSITISRVLSSDALQPGESVAVLQPGGEFEGIRYQIDGDPVLEVGAAYLFFLAEYRGLEEISIAEPWGLTYSTAPYGRFTIEEGKLRVSLPEWLCRPCRGPRALEGRSLQEAESRVRKAAAGTLGEVELAPAITPEPSPDVVLPTTVVEFDEHGRPYIPAGSEPRLPVSPAPNLR